MEGQSFRPMADMSTGNKGKKQSCYIHRKQHEPLFIAALANFGPAWDNWATSGFTIVTADAVDSMVDVHDRWSIVFSAVDTSFWLDKNLG